MPLATLDEVKLKAGVPLSNTSFDVPIQNALSAADRYVRNVTGWEDTAGTITEYVTNFQLGRFLNLKKRPMAAITTIQGKRPGDSDWTVFSADIIDPIQGQILPINNVGGLSSGFPSRNFIQTLQVVYTTSGDEAPDDLADAVAALAAYWYRRDRAHAIDLQYVGAIRTHFLQMHVPPWIEARLEPYTRPIGGLV